MAMPMLVLTMSGIVAPSSSKGWRITSSSRSATSSGATLSDAAVDQDDELVAAHPPDRVGVSQGARQPGRHRDQQLVTGVMAQGVVDVLEVVQIDVQRRADGPVAAVAGQELLDAVHDQRPVRQARSSASCRA